MVVVAGGGEGLVLERPHPGHISADERGLRTKFVPHALVTGGCSVVDLRRAGMELRGAPVGLGPGTVGPVDLSLKHICWDGAPAHVLLIPSARTVCTRANA